MTDLDELAARLRRLEDDRDIRQLIASYGLAVDAGTRTPPRACGRATACMTSTAGEWRAGPTFTPW